MISHICVEGTSIPFEALFIFRLLSGCWIIHWFSSPPTASQLQAGRAESRSIWFVSSLLGVLKTVLVWDFWPLLQTKAMSPEGTHSPTVSPKLGGEEAVLSKGTPQIPTFLPDVQPLFMNSLNGLCVYDQFQEPLHDGLVVWLCFVVYLAGVFVSTM